MGFTFCFVFLCSLSLAAHDFMTLEKKEVPGAPSQTVRWEGHYVHPNELTPGQIDSHTLSSIQGLLVSVGTIRTLVVFCWASEITHLLMTDIDNKVTCFNRNHLHYIYWLSQHYPNNLTAQRIHYMANFLGYEPMPEEISTWAQQDLSITQLQREINNGNRELQDFGKDNWFLKLDFQKKWLEQHLTLSNLFGYQQVKNEKFYWEEDSQWKKIIDALTHNRIAVTNLSVTTDLPLLNAFIENLAISFGAFDISNIPTFQRSNSEQWRQALKQIHPPEKVMYTALNGGVNFTYCCDNFERFLSYLEFGIGF